MALIAAAPPYSGLGLDSDLPGSPTFAVETALPTATDRAAIAEPLPTESRNLATRQVCSRINLPGLRGAVRIDEAWDPDCDQETASGATSRQMSFSLSGPSFVRMELYSLDRVSILLSRMGGTQSQPLTAQAGNVLTMGPNVPRDHTLAWRQDVLRPGTYQLELRSHAPHQPGRFIFRLRAQPVPTTKLRFTDISAGYLRSCGILESGTPLCWGLETRDSDLAANRGPLTQIAVGPTREVCGLNESGVAVCWGYSEIREFHPDPDQKLVQIDIGPHRLCGVQDNNLARCWPSDRIHDRNSALTDIAQIATNRGIQCALNTDGSAECWGDQVFFGDTRAPAGEKFVALGTGERHACGLREDMTLLCWGDGGQGTCSVNEDGSNYCGSAGPSGAPTPPDGEQIATLSSGEAHCGLRPDGMPVCWTQFAELGLVPPPARQLSSISATATLACGLDDAGTAICWGDDRFGQASPPGGINATGEVSWPVPRDLVEVSAGTGHACAVDLQGGLTCWGPNWWNGRFPRDREYVAVGSGSLHACALEHSGTVICRGNDDSGQSSPPLGLTFDSISVGRSVSCGIKRDRTAICWGAEYRGRLDVPQNVRFRTIDVSSGPACGITEAGEAICWGRDAAAHVLAPGSGRPLPVEVSTAANYSCYLLQAGSIRCLGDSEFELTEPPAGNDFVQVSSGGYLACGLRQDGTVNCWGAWFIDPISPPEDETFKQISAGSRFACGITVAGSAHCWGDTDGGLGQPRQYVSPP